MTKIKFGFDHDAFVTLCALTTDWDTAGVTDWMQEHIKHHHDMHALLESLCRAIYSTWPLSLTKGVNLGEGDHWAMEANPDATPESIASTQLITAALNADWDNLTALINALVRHRSEEFHAAVTVHVLVAVGDGLRAVIAERQS